MGSSQSVATAVSHTIEQSSAMQTCQTNCTADNSIGPIDIDPAPCCDTSVTINMEASGKCNCPMGDISTQLAKNLQNASADAKASFSLATASSKTNVQNTTEIKNTIDQACKSSSSAVNTLKRIHIGNSGAGNCCNMNEAAKESMEHAAKTINMNASAQAQCLMSIAAKMDSNSTENDDSKGLSTDPGNMALSNMEDFASKNMLVLGAVGGGIVLIIVIMMLSKSSKKKRNTSSQLEMRSF